MTKYEIELCDLYFNVMAKKKICCITTIDSTLIAFVADAMYQFVDKGFDVTLVCSDTTRVRKLKGDAFKYVNIPMKRGISFSDILVAPWRFYKLFKQEQFDFVQYATPNASLYASIGAWLAKIPIRLYCQWGIRYVGYTGIMRYILRALEKITCTLSTHICAASQKNLDYSVKQRLYKVNKAEIIGDGGTIGVDMAKFNISMKKLYRDDIRSKYPNMGENIVFCSVGRMSRDKGSVETLAAFNMLLRDRDDVILLMIGESENIQFENLINRYKSDRVIFTGHTDEVYKYMAASDVMLHPSYREGFSMVIQEAMAMGLPVITTNIPGPSEVIENNVTGILVEPRDIMSLYDAMKRFVIDREMAVNMGNAGRKRCERLFNRERMLRLTFEHRMKLIENKELN